VVNGGDMLPMGGDLHGPQGEFIEEFLEEHFREYSEAGIAWLGMLGNDDLKIHDAAFDEVCRRNKNIFNLAQHRIELGGYEFIGMNWVTDYPFRLKDRCLRDGEGYVFQEQYGSGLLSTPEGFRELDDWQAYAAGLPTMEQELAALPKPAEPKKTIYVIHTPPAGLGLDVILSGEKVGSRAVAKFIKKMGPLLTLHGHIHESPEMSGVWKARSGKTVCVQPGQARNGVTYVLADLAAMSMERFVEPL
jgi:Icc-related predicted phosphoesterase